MARALYEEHPLEEYLRASGDKPERVPGAFTDDSDEEVDDASVRPCVDATWSSSFHVGTVETLRRWSSTFKNILPSTNDDFAERFKYDLISSNLLSSSVASSPIVPHSRTRPPSPDRPLPGALRTTHEDAVEKSNQELRSVSSAFVLVGLAALLNQHRVAAALALATSLSFAKPSAPSKQKYIPLVFESLENLKAAGVAWDSVVNDATMILEGEDRSPYFSSSSSAPPSPSSALRISLHSTLITTQLQCDNVRPLLAALASPSELSQLSEMYAPPSPIKPSFSLQSRPTTPGTRRISLSENSIFSPSPSPRASKSEKRQTWNGSNMSPLGSNSRTSSVLRKRDRRRSDLATFLGVQDPNATVSTAPTTPRSPPLPQVLEADEEDEDYPLDELDASKDNFGTAALFLRRKRRASGIDALGLSSSRSVPILRNPSPSTPLSSLSSSRFTSMQSSRNPLSPSALHHALQGALASRRYACAHLLALRFNEDAEDESYWEDVRSVVALLTSTLEDATARLGDALDEADRMRKQEAQPSPSPSPCPTPNFDSLDQSFSTRHPLSPPSLSQLKLSVPMETQLPLSPMGVQSFAPAPNTLARFASHVDVLTSAMDDARENLQQCVTSLQDDSGSAVSESTDVDATEQTALQAYERLRRELGLALRECERGKAALTDLFDTRRRSLQPSVDFEEDGVPSLAHDNSPSGSSGDSDDKHDIGPFTPDDGSPVLHSLTSLDNVLASHLQNGVSQPERDDVTQHLLLTASSSHLPPPGVEQVFESEAAALTPLLRERSKLSREERIKQMRSKRESLQGRSGPRSVSPGVDLSTDADHRARAGWGPSVDVVEELKDVIWKVGERRRRMVDTNPVVIPSPISRSTAPMFVANTSHADLL